MIGIQDERVKREKLLKKGLIILGSFLIVLVILLIGLKVLDAQTNKIFIDEREVAYDKLIHTFEGEKYIDLKEMSRMFPSFTYSTGEYFSDGTVNQDPNYFHLKSPYEVVQFQKESDKMHKIILVDNNYYQYDYKGNRILSKEEESKGKEDLIERQEIDNKKRSTEEFNLADTIIEVNNKQYVPFEDVQYVFNVQTNIVDNSIKLYTVEYLEKLYASALNRSNLHLNPNYQNRRAILDGYYITTTNATNPIYGVQIYENGIFTTQISESYKDIRYMQASKTIFVINNQDAFGLINIEKATDIIKPGLYESIEAYLPELDLYQVTNVQGKLGVIEASEEEVRVIVHLEYDEIGYDTAIFTDHSHGKIFFDSLIPAKKENRWYIFDLKNPRNIYGSNIGGYLDLGYKAPELLGTNSRNEPEFTEEQIEELTNRGYAHLIKADRSEDEATKALRFQALEREGYVLNKERIPEGESVLVVPDSTSFGGLLVKSTLSGKYVYYIISSDEKTRDSGLPYALTTPYTRIYKLTVDGIERYFSIGVDSSKYELRQKEPTVDTTKKEDNSNQENEQNNTNTESNSSQEQNINTEENTSNTN